MCSVFRGGRLGASRLSDFLFWPWRWRCLWKKKVIRDLGKGDRVPRRRRDLGAGESLPETSSHNPQRQSGWFPHFTDRATEALRRGRDVLKVLIEFLAERGPAQGTSHHVELPRQGRADATSPGKPLWIAPGQSFPSVSALLEAPCAHLLISAWHLVWGLLTTPCSLRPAGFSWRSGSVSDSFLSSQYPAPGLARGWCLLSVCVWGGTPTGKR